MLLKPLADSLTPGELAEAFNKAFPDAGQPQYCRAPGRVNIIGEHTDYNGLPVLPTTIGQDIRIAFAPREDRTIRVRSLRGYPERQFENSIGIPPSPAGTWDNYCKAAIEGLNLHFGLTEPKGMDLLVTGTVPVSAGLSSSSALVVACALAYLRSLGLALEKGIARLELAEVLAEAEHYVGTRGGGMDQATILLGHEHSACKIDFFPLRYESVPLHDTHTIIVCNSLVKAEKTGQALHRYNAGPRLCQLACAMVAHRIHQNFGEEIRIVRLGDLFYGHLCLTVTEVEALFQETFPQSRFSLEDAAQSLDMTPDEIRTRWLGDLHEPPEGYRLQARARHQLTEYQRVEAARDALNAGDMGTLGDLMNASHESCAEDFEISCPELQQLTRIAREAGAIGSRLTGAGFGGCTVNLVPKEGVQEFMTHVGREYYANYLGKEPNAFPNGAVFVAEPSPPAGYL